MRKPNTYSSRIARRAAFWLLCTVTLATLQAQETAIRILHTNDMHSRVEPIENNAVKNPGTGGLVRRATLVREQREAHEHLLLFDSGDFSQGTPYYNLFKGKVEIECMNRMGYSAATIGNHEFDFGLENMAELFRQAEFPFVCANYDFTGTVLEGLVKPYEILECGGIKIGVFGLSPRLEGLVQAENFRGVQYNEPDEVAGEIAALLKNQKGCDIVICLSHLGLSASAFNPVSDERLVQNTRHIDLILGGHSHHYLEGPVTYRNADGAPVYISQMGRDGSFVGYIDLKIRK